MESPLPEYSVEDSSEMTMFSPLPNDDEDEEFRQQSDSNFSDTNYFKSGDSGQNTERPHRFETPVPRHRSRSQSPEGTNTGSDPSWTLRSSDNVTYPDLASLDSPRHNNQDMLQATSPLTLKTQAEIDEEWKLALQLQREEDYAIEERGRQMQDDYAYKNDRGQNSPDDASLSFNFAFAPWRASGARQRFSISFPSPKRTLIPRGDTASGPDSPSLGTQANASDLNKSTLYRKFVDTILNDKTSALLKTLVRREREQIEVPTRICVVDGEACSIASMPTLSACSHYPNYCAECYQHWLTAQLEDSSWREARCPERGCNTLLTYREMQQHASQESFELYDKFLTRAALNQDPDFQWCRACESGQVHDGGGVENNIFTCVACGDKVCIVHNTWHEDETCQEYEYRASGQQQRDRIAQEEASLAAIGQWSKKCPGPGCAYNIEKNDGCDHMTCSNCNYQFCWLCLCDYKRVLWRGNSAHAGGCKYKM